MCAKYMWLDMPDAFCCRLSLFRVFAKIKKTVSTSPGLPYIEEDVFPWDKVITDTRAMMSEITSAVVHT